MHLMRWQQLFPQIFLRSYPFPVHLKSIFVAGASWKVVQGKTKLTLLTYVRSEEDDPLGPTPLNIYLLYYLLRDLFPCFLFLGRIIIKEWDSYPTQRLKFWPSHIIMLIFLERTLTIDYNQTCSQNLYISKFVAILYILRQVFIRFLATYLSLPTPNAIILRIHQKPN